MAYYKILISAFFFLIVNNFTLEAQQDRAAIYSALSSGKSSVLDKQLATVKNSKGDAALAYEGTLLMRKAATLKIPGQKLKMFKQGHKQLEKAISINAKNVEYRFLRLMIQENAPKILNYKKDIEADKQIIKMGYNALQPELKTIIYNYSKTSKVLPSGILK